MSNATASSATTRRTRKSIAAIPSSDTIFDKENSTIHGIGNNDSQRKAAVKKSRSKSLGPGGLEALQEGTGNGQKIAIVPRSILKPTIPLSPPKAIPPHPNSKKTSPAKGKAGSSPVRKSPTKRTPTASQSGLDNVPNPFEDEFKNNVNSGDANKVQLKTEEEQQAAAREREKQEAIKRRDERRKSLANRRVSFAPEATMHTWEVVELPDDATSSSEATNSTRRASSASSMPASPFTTQQENTDSGRSPSVNPEEEIQVAASPAEKHKKRRRSSTGYDQQQDFSSSPLSSAGSDDASMMTEEDAIIDASDSDSDKDIVEQEETIDNIDEPTSQSVAFLTDDTGSNNTSQRLDEALRQATLHAGSQKASQDDDGDVSMEMATGEVTYAFKPWASKSAAKPNLAREISSNGDQENVNPFAAPASVPSQANEDDEEMTMDVTQAIGGIVSVTNSQQPPKKVRRKSVVGNRRKSNMTRRRSSVHPENEDQTMELTTAIGGIQPSNPFGVNAAGSGDGDEDMSMEFTAVLGGVVDRNKNEPSQDDDTLASQQLLQEHSISEATMDHDANEDMDITAPVGGILTPVTEHTEPSQDNTGAMDITTAVGAILPKDLRVEGKNEAKALMEEEADHGQLTKSPFVRQTSTDMLKSATPNHVSVIASETGSPSIVAGQGRTTRRSAGLRKSTTPKTSSKQTTPLKKPTTPSKQATPQPARPETPSKTPPAKNVAMRRTSPKRLFKQIASPKPDQSTPKSDQPTLTFSQDTTTGEAVPSVVLTPKQRRVSGLGIDKAGIGSPRAAALLDRRASLGDQAAAFTPQGAAKRGVRFADPRELEQEVDKEHAEHQRRESGRGILEREANGSQDDDKDATINLRDMINSMTPRKNKLKGRKSLAVGAARGLLGKRPAELDDEEEDATPKRLKGNDNSPVKNIHLPAPPTKDETTGRLGKAPRFNLGEVSNNVVTPTTEDFSPEKITTPRDQGRFKDTEAVKSASKPPVSFNEQMAGAPAEIEQDPEEERIHLQDFLNMTSIRFMELTTTKRRHTVAPNKSGEDNTLPIGEQAKADDDRRLSACIVAGASTIPMLELYQHSCRELKKYISEGRSIVKEIETDTYEENPTLFREYMTASPSVRSLMDNQFKNIKTHARLLSKGMWYEWRTKLLDGLKEGLFSIANDLSVDADILNKQEEILSSVLPPLVQTHEKLSTEQGKLQDQMEALASCDQDELQETRNSLTSVDGEIAAKKAEIASLQTELAQQETAIEISTERKAICSKEIEEAERIREECRGWSPQEVAALKSNVEALEKQTGWTITSAQENTVTFMYQSELSLFLAPGAFAPHAHPESSNGSISLSYTPKVDKEPTTTQRFFLQLLRARLLSAHQAQTPMKQILSLVKNGWDTCAVVASQIDALNGGYQTTSLIVNDETLQASLVMLLRDMRTKITLSYNALVGGLLDGISSTVTVKARVVYGEDLNEAKMDEFLSKRVEGLGGWAQAAHDLEARLKARGKKKECA